MACVVCVVCVVCVCVVLCVYVVLCVCVCCVCASGTVWRVCRIIWYVEDEGMLTGTCTCVYVFT